MQEKQMKRQVLTIWFI